MSTTFRTIVGRWFVLLAIALAHEARAQSDVTVTTLVKPPYSPYLSDYVGFDNKIVVTLVNTRNVAQSLRLAGQLKGNNGVTITIPENFVPALPITLAPNQVRVLMGSQLKEYLDPDNLQFAGITKVAVVQGNGLPEGDYSLCIRALDYNSGAPKSLAAPSGCAQFAITHYEPPMLLAPACNAVVTPKSPQSLIFSWTIPAGAPPAKVEYRLRIVEMIPPDISPDQAMAAATDPPFFETTVQGTSFLYGPAAPKLETGARYAVRVTALNKGGAKELNFKNGGRSVVCAFTYGKVDLVDQGGGNDGDEGGKDEDEPDDDADVQENYAPPCTALNCAPQPLAAAVPSDKTYAPGDEIQIGYFTLKLTSLVSASAGNLGGEGVIDAPIFHTKLKATFTGLKVNPEGKVYAGKAIGAYDPGAQVDNAMKGFADGLQSVAADKVHALSDYVKGKGKYIENFVDADAQGLPFGWNKPINGNIQLVDIASVEFAPDGARFNAFLDIPIPEAQNQILAFGQKNICFHPTGLSVDGLQKLTMLGQDRTFPWGDKINLTVKAAGNNGGTFVRWDCKGYHDMQIDGYFTFKGELLQKAEGNGDVKASFTFSNAPAWGDMLGEITMDPFTIKGMKGLRLSFDKVVLDFSDTRNAQGMAFPANYQGGTGNDWRGFYFKQIKATLPKYLKRGKAPVEITIANALVNKLGFTGGASVAPVFSIGEGNIGGWGFSMEKIQVEVLNNSLTKGTFNGRLKMPVATTELGYGCLLSSVGGELKTAFAVENIGDVDVDMWAAKLTIDDGSSVTVSSQNDDVTVRAELSGSLTVDRKFADLKGVSVKIPGVKFEDFAIQNKKPYLSATLFKFASPEKSFAGFPVSIDPKDGIQAVFQENGTKAGLRLGFHVGLDGNKQSAISGGTTFTLWGTMTEKEGKQSWAAAKPTLDAITIKASVASCDMEGQINLYNGDPTFGDGFRGAIMVNFRPLVKLNATVQFGSTGYKSNASYRYWYVDAMAVMGTGIPVFPGFGIYGFGGGAYYHMKAEDAMPAASKLAGDPDKTSFDQDKGGASPTGVIYKPNPNLAFGFKASIVMGTMPKPNAFNGDITLEASFFNGGGLNAISLVGNGYFMQSPDPKARPAKEKAVVAATVAFSYSTQKAAFDGLIDMHINLKAGKKSLIEGGGQASMHFSKGKWFIKLGEPTNPIGLTVLDLLQIDSYLMVGKNSLPGLPQLPTSPINFRQKLPSFNSKNPRDPSTETGSGFALGQQLSVNTGKLKFLIFYAQILIDFGYDVSVLDLDQECEYAEGGKMGFKGWYAQGQVYAGLQASVGIDINLWFLRTDVELFKVGLYAGLRAGLPNPTWMQGEVAGEYSALNGLLSGHCNFKFKYGDKCDVTSGDPFGGLKIIADVKPSGGDADVFSYPEAAYNLPMGEPISVQVVDGDDKVKTTTFRFGVKSFEVINKKSKAAVAGDHQLANKKLSTLFIPDRMFDEKTSYTTRVKVYGDRFEKGKWVRIGEKNDAAKEHLETEEREFTTGDAPETFSNANIIATIPGRMQRYFLHDQANTGYVAFNQFPNNIAELEPKEKDEYYSYVARFQEIGSGSSIAGEVPLKWEPSSDKKRVSFPLPDLKKERIYIIQFIRKKLSKSKKPAGGNTSTTVESKGIGDRQHIDIRKTRLDAIKLGDEEFLVYQLAFRTSKYRNFKDKLDSYHQKSVTTGSGDYANTLYTEYEGGEAMDWYDLHQSTYAQGSVTRYIEPNIRVGVIDRSNVKSDYFWSNLKSEYLDFINDGVLNNALSVETTDPKTQNPRTVRSYPSPGAYGSGSRLTNGSRIPKVPFPINAAGISYEGTGNPSKLTNEEINAAYWKNLGSQGDGGNGPGINGVKVSGPVPKPVSAPKEENRLVIRYDAVNVLRRDQKIVYHELENWAGLNPSKSAMNAVFQSYLHFNSPKVWDTGKENQDYLEIRIRPYTNYAVTLDFGYGEFLPRTLSSELPH